MSTTAHAGDGPARRPLPRHGESRRVLLVDDDEDYVQFVKQLISRLGHREPLDMAHDEPTALRMIDHTQYDVVVSDYELGSGNGIRVLEHVRRMRPSAERILLTSAPDKALRHFSNDGGLVHRIWDKKWELATIQEQLRNLLRPAS